MAKKKDRLWQKSDFDALKDKELTTDELRSRHALRYACFRMKKERLQGVKCTPELEAIAKPLQKLDGFESWETFAETWDVARPDPPEIVKRMWTIYQEHDQMLSRVAQPLPKA